MGDAGERTAADILLLLGLKVADPELLELVSLDAQCFLIHVLEDAFVLCSVDRRSRLSVHDVNDSLRIKDLAPLHGYSSKTAPKTVQFKYSRDQDLIAFQHPQRPIFSFEQPTKCEYQSRPTFDGTWLVFSRRICIRPSSPIRPPSPDREQIKINWRNTPPPLRSYFAKTIEKLRGDNLEFECALSAMASSDGIGALLPQYLEFIIESLKRPSVTAPSVLSGLVKLARFRRERSIQYCGES
jgi:hypothetical protein